MKLTAFLSGVGCCIALPFITTAQSNYALSLNGTNQYVTIGSPIASGSYTKEAWVYLTTNSGNIISSATNFLRVSGGHLEAGQGSDIVTSSSAMPQGQWVHVAVSFDLATTTLKLYQDGVLVGFTSASDFTGTTTYIGYNGSASDLNGNVDEVRIWNVALTQDQIKQNMYKGPAASATGLVSYYKCNENGGTALINAATITGATNNGSFSPTSPTWVASPVQASNNALKFGASIDDHVSITNLNANIVRSSFTVEYLMNTTSIGSGSGQWYGGKGIVDAEEPGGTNDWGTALLGSKVGFGIGGNSGPGDVTIHSTTAINTGSWVHVAGTWDQTSGKMVLYINGIAEDSAIGSTSLRNNYTKIRFGELQTGIQPYDGAIDEVRIWNEVRTPQQIQANMFKEIDPTAEPKLAAYYTFNQGITTGTNAGLLTLTDMKGENNGTLTGFTLSGASSNFIGQSGSVTPLALDWLSFSAQAQGDKVLLNWSTANEKNTTGFNIQHSTDGQTWHTIGTTAAAGNSVFEKSYSFIDGAPQKGINYYRIQQIDVDGQSSYSAIRKVNFDHNIVATIQAHAVVDGILQLKLNGGCDLYLYSSEGKLLLQKQANAGSVSIDMSSYPKGIYLLRVNNQTEKIVLQ